ncbi:protein kinase [Oscillochloris trichoides DG-6]|uniref:non-specific serine/threonine protein kinase n=1 Tax=Oscillochloris trichoides DG-6 TaxID=765420 RepID=E1IIP5_9CHLR|nr:protein kinase [Oscillochloris trichoides]EFO78951.1 protein kinase [Oscillochloris trichoides DG-6]
MSDDLTGRTMGRYQVLERLGRGGMAEVYRAYQPTLDRFVALKVIYPHLASDPDLLERFGREARAVAALHHPNIVQVHDFDVHEGTAFMAMEFVSGPTLKAAIQSLHRRGKLLPIPVVGQIIGQLADALGYAHEQRVIHRDVKPANVLIRRRGAADAALNDADIDALLLNLTPTSVVLTDFGVARIIKDSVEHTAAGTILGSPAYMSPEQGRGERVDARSDIYSLGIVLYELLIGQVPFDADTPFAIVMKHSTAALPPPRSLRPDLPIKIEQVLLKALAKDPAQRFQDAAAFGAALREATASLANQAPQSLVSMQAVTDPDAISRSRETRVLEMTSAASAPTPLPTLPSAAPSLTKKRSCLRKSAIMIGVLSTLAVLVVGAFIAGGMMVFRGLNEAGALVVPTELSMQATAAAAEGDILPITPRPPDPNDPLANGLRACSAPGCPGGNADEALRIYTAALDRNPDNPALLAARAQLYIWWDVYTYTEQARADIEAALALDPQHAPAYVARAELIAMTTEDDQSHRQALQDLDRAIELDPNLMAAYIAHARLLTSAPDFYDTVSKSRQRVISDTSTVLAREPNNISALNLRAEANYTESRYDEALGDTNTVLKLDPRNFEALLRRARLNRYAFQNPQAALADFTAAIGVDPNQTEAREGRAAMLIQMGNYPLALEDAEAMIEMSEDDPFVSTFRGFIFLHLDRPAEALEDFSEALEAEADNIEARYGRGLALLAQQQAEAALPDLEAAREHQDGLGYINDVFYQSHPSAELSLARAYMQLGRMADAQPLINASIEQSPDWYLPYLIRARYHRATGDIAAARDDLREAIEYAQTPAERAAIEAEQRREP